MTIMYLVEAFRWGAGKITPTQIASCTGKTVTMMGGKKQRMQSEWHAWFATEEHARAFLYTNAVEKAQYYRDEAHKWESAAGQWRPK